MMEDEGKVVGLSLADGGHQAGWSRNEHNLPVELLQLAPFEIAAERQLAARAHANIHT